jgi:hypothetical protein
MTNRTYTLLAVIAFVALPEFAQDLRANGIVLKNWPTPLMWQPTAVEADAAKPRAVRDASNLRATAPANALVFVAMTPCRVADTRPGWGFGPPGVPANSSRTFAIQANADCPVPALARAYSLNVTAVPRGPLGFLTIWPTGQPRPLASTLNSPDGSIVANAAIVPAGAGGAVDVYASNDADVVIDLNGYFATPTGLTLDLGSASAPSLSFAGDSGTGLFSSGAGNLNLSTGGVTRFTVRPDGDLDLAGNIRKGGTLFAHTRGSATTGIGLGALTNATADFNTAVGTAALASNTTGTGNVAIGGSALSQNIEGLHNTAAGLGALMCNNGNENTAHGYLALTTNVNGTNNTATGAFALQDAIGSYNTADGCSALGSLTTGSHNTAIGYAALGTLNIGSDNTAVGGYALQLATMAAGNTAVGRYALANNLTGYGNIALGLSAGVGIQGNDNISIGNIGYPADNYTIRIGDQYHQRFFATGIFGKTVGGAAVPVLIDTNNQLGTISSSRRYKEDIRDMDDASAALLRLRPVTFRYQRAYADGSKPLDYGLIAEEVAEIYPDLVVRGADGRIESVQYQKLTPMLLNELQREHHRVERQQQRMDEQQKQIEDHQRKLAALEEVVQELRIRGAGPGSR